MNKVFTLTVNPVVDKNTQVSALMPNDELPCTSPTYRAGGGGINVSQALKNLGGNSHAFFFKGGRTGQHLEDLMVHQGLNFTSIRITGQTRENLSIDEKATDLEYRFSLPGPQVREKEWQASLNSLRTNLSAGDYLVASGKLCKGMPTDYYVKVATIVKQQKGRFILDTSGDALIPSLKADIFLMKPNLSELGIICGTGQISYHFIKEKVQAFMGTHRCEVMVVSLGVRGALLVTDRLFVHIPAPTIAQRSRIGAGDSMVAGMIFSLNRGMDLTEMVRYGVACGAAATMREGTQLCIKTDVEDCYRWMKSASDRERKLSIQK